MSSYWPSIVLVPFLIYNIGPLARYWLKISDFNIPTCVWHPRWDEPSRTLKKIFVVGKLEPLGCCSALFA